MQSRYRKNRLKRIEKELLEAEKEYDNTSSPYEEESSSRLESLSTIFSEIFGEKIVFVDVTPERE